MKYSVLNIDWEFVANKYTVKSELSDFFII